MKPVAWIAAAWVLALIGIASSFLGQIVVTYGAAMLVALIRLPLLWTPRPPGPFWTRLDVLYLAVVCAGLARSSFGPLLPEPLWPAVRVAALCLMPPAMILTAIGDRHRLSRAAQDPGRDARGTA